MLSRVADSLYWMARYLERAEQVARLIDINLNLMLDQTAGQAEERWGRVIRACHVISDGDPLPDVDPNDTVAVVRRLAFDPKNGNSLRSCIGKARENARQVRQEISSPMFEHLNAMYFKVRDADADALLSRHQSDYFREVRYGVNMFNGLTYATLDHGEEWGFIRLGRFLEQSVNTTDLLREHTSGDAAAADGDDGFEAVDYLTWVGLLKSAVAFESHQRKHSGTIDPQRALQFLLLDATFPRAVRFGIERVAEATQMIAELSGTGRGQHAERLVGRLLAKLRFVQIEEVIGNDLAGFFDSITDDCDAIHHAVYRSYITYPVEEMAA